MKDDRLRIPGDQAYFQSVGLATIAFARLEWDVVWLCERIEPGYIHTIDATPRSGGRVGPGKTAGKIATDFLERAGELNGYSFQPDLVAEAERFRDLVVIRNALLHGKPGTAPGGEQRLFRMGEVWSIDRVNDAADDFTECSLRLNAYLYGHLKEGWR